MFLHDKTSNLHWVILEDVSEIMRGSLAEVGLTSREACGNTVTKCNV